MNWTHFPPKADADRIAGYVRYEAHYKGLNCIERYNGAKILGLGLLRRKIGLVVNYPGVISRVCADFLFGEAPRFVCGEPDSPEQKALDEIVERNELHKAFYESALSNSCRGDAVFRSRWGPRNPGEDDDVVVEELPATSYFPELSEDNCRWVISQSIAWLRSDNVLRVETHYPGRIVQKAFLCESVGKNAAVGPELPLEWVYPNADERPLDEVETGVKTPLVTFVPNMRVGSDYFGTSDYYDLETLFEAYNNRISKVDAYLDRHASPKLVSLPGLIGPDGKVDMDKLEMIEAQNPELAKYLPRYVTWDGQMQSSFDELEHLIDAIFKVSEIAPAVFGEDKAGSIESGRAMRMRFIRTIAKINRKRLYYHTAIVQVLKAALALYAAKKGVKLNLDQKIDIFWQDGLPQDYVEAVDAAAKRIESGTQSRETAIRELDGSSPGEARAELERVLEEDSKFAGPTSVGGETNTDARRRPGRPAGKRGAGPAQSGPGQEPEGPSGGQQAA